MGTDWLAFIGIALTLSALAYWAGYRIGRRKGYHAGISDGVWETVRSINAMRRPKQEP